VKASTKIVLRHYAVLLIFGALLLWAGTTGKGFKELVTLGTAFWFWWIGANFGFILGVSARPLELKDKS